MDRLTMHAHGRIRSPPAKAPAAGRRYKTKTLARWALTGCSALLLVALGLYTQTPPLSREEAEISGHIRAAPSKAFCDKNRPPLVCAHGGAASTTAPPNTADSFRAALRLGADCVEVDAARTADGVLVVMHVRELQQLMRMAAPEQQAKLLGAGRQLSTLQVGDLTHAQLSTLSWRPGGQRVLTVREALAITKSDVDCVTLDVKTYQDSKGRPTDGVQIADQLVMLVHEARCSNCLIWAKSDEVVAHVKRVSPGQRAGYIVMNETAGAIKEGMHLPLRMQDPEVVGMHFAMVDPYHLELLHGAGKQLHSWTINNASLLHWVLDVGVDAVVTNDPKMAMEAIESRLAQCGGRGDDL